MNPPILSDAAEHEFFQLLERARQGDADALGVLINRYRKYLLKIAFDEGDTDLQAKAGDSDIVQNTCVQAIRVFPDFKGQTSAEMRAWLRQILIRQLGDLQDHYNTRKRNIGEEVSLQAFETPESRNEILEDDASSPSVHVIRQEESDWLERALKELSDLDRTIIEMRQKDGRPFAEIGRAVQMSEDAVQKRWVRALQELQKKVQQRYGRSFE